MQYFSILLGIFITITHPIFGQTLELRDVVKAIEQNSLELIDNKAQFESMLAEGKSSLAWEYPFIEANGGSARENGQLGGEWQAIVFVKPKLWWVNPLLRESLKSKGMQYQKSHHLIRNINFIAVKRIYLTYVATKEKYKFYLKREENLLRLLSIAKRRLEGGSISRKDLVNFESAYLDSTLASVAVRNELLELQKSLFIILGLENQEYISHFEPENMSDSKESDTHAKITPKAESDNSYANAIRKIEQDVGNIMALHGYYDTTLESTHSSDTQSQTEQFLKTTHHDIVIKDLNFVYINTDKKLLEEKLKNSLYTEILDLQAKEYQSMSQYEGRNHWGALELGAGISYSLSSYNPIFQVSVPLPVSKKQSLLKAKYMALENGALSKSTITKKQIAIKAKAYLEELLLQEKYIDIAKNNIKTKQHLAELNRLAYETQQVTLFEYITQENAFVDSQIELVNSQIKYINLVSFLEETLGESFTKID